MQLSLSHNRVSFQHCIYDYIVKVRYNFNTVHYIQHIRNKPYLGDDSAPRGYDELKDNNELGNYTPVTTE